MQLVDKSAANPALAQWIFSPSNLAETASALRMKNYKVAGASSVTKQQAEFEILLRSGPMPNPQLVQMQAGVEKITSGMKDAAARGEQVPPEAVAMVAQVTQSMQALPPQVSTIPVVQDESENHLVEMTTCFDWLNSVEGQKLRFGNSKQQEGFANVHLHWQEHGLALKKITAMNQPPQKPPSESISVDVSKMPPPIAVQALAKMQIQATPQMFDQQAETALNHKVAGKAIPEALKQPIE
jgi:hypothetical protein